MTTPSDVIKGVLEANLGTPTSRFHYGERLHIFRFDDEREDIATFATIGLSDTVLAQETGAIRQELITDCWRRFADRAWTTLLGAVAGQVALRGRALAAFEVLTLDDGLRRLTGAFGVMAFAPIHHPETIHLVPRTDPPTLIVWLMPLTEPEVHLADESGWEALADLFEDVQPDFLDLRRRSAA